MHDDVLGRLPTEELLASRLRAILVEHPLAPEPEIELAAALQRMTDLLATADDGETKGWLWLLYIVFVSELPTEERARKLQLQLSLNGPDAVIDALRLAAQTAPPSWAAHAPIRLLRRPVVEVSRCASTDLHTGIQRVVREVVPRWVANFDAELAVLDPSARVLRPPSADESARVLRWGSTGSNAATEPVDTRVILIPWKTTLVLPEYSTDRAFGALLAPLARWSGNEVGALFYDATPYAFPDFVSDRALGTYGRHIAVLRAATRVSAISRTAANGITALASLWTDSGIAGPLVAAQPLPLEPTGAPDPTNTDLAESTLDVSTLPLVLSVSSIAPHKNQLSILLAAERLWNEGHQFQLLFIAGSGWERENFDSALAELQNRGRPVRVISTASEELLWSAYQLARFSVFVSITEGFGLPAAESIAAGTPVLLSNHGSMREIGEGGGAHFVNPHEQDEITAGMRRLLTDDDYLGQLAEQARNRQLPTWDDYAADTWNWLVKGKQTNADG